MYNSRIPDWASAPERDRSSRIIEKNNKSTRVTIESAPYRPNASDMVSGVKVPVYPRISLAYIDTETLDHYNLPWQFDRSNQSWVIVLREMDDVETDLLFRHTARRRKDALRKIEPRPTRPSRNQFEVAEISGPSASPDKLIYTQQEERDPQTNQRGGISRPAEFSKPFETTRTAMRSMDEGSDYALIRRPQSFEIARYDEEIQWVENEVDYASDYSLDLDGSSEQVEHMGKPSSDPSISAEVVSSLGQKFNSVEIQVLPTKYASSLGSSRVAASILVRDKSTKPPPKSGTFQASNAPYSPTLFKWLHLEQKFMNFQSFKEYVLKVVVSPPGEKKELLKLFEDIQGYETRRRMNPGLKSSFEKPNWATANATSILWLCFPYLSFQGYKMTKPPEHISDHPNRTLMQFYETASGKDRELQQTLTKDTKSDKCLFASQTWCLVLNQHTIITCAQLTIDELRGDIVKLVPQLHPFPDDVKAQTEDSSPYLCVHDRGNCIYLLPVERCQSWVEFISQFVDLKYSSFDIYENNTRVTSSNWKDLQLVQRAKSALIVLILIPITRSDSDSSSSEHSDSDSSESSGHFSSNEQEEVPPKDEQAQQSPEHDENEQIERVNDDDMVEVVEYDSSSGSSKSSKPRRRSEIASDTIVVERVIRTETVRYQGPGEDMEHSSDDQKRPGSGRDARNSTSAQVGEHKSLVPRQKATKGHTRLPKRLVHKQALANLGYSFVEEQHFIVVSHPLEKEQIDELIRIGGADETSNQNSWSVTDLPRHENTSTRSQLHLRSLSSVVEESHSARSDLSSTDSEHTNRTSSEIVEEIIGRQSAPQGSRNLGAEDSHTSSISADDDGPKSHSRRSERSFSKRYKVHQLPILDCTTDLDQFRVFTWMSAISTVLANPSSPLSTDRASKVDATQPDKEIKVIDLKKLDNIAHSLHEFLSKNKRANERITYKQCPQMTYSAFKAEFDEQTVRTDTSNSSTSSLTRSFVKSAETLFQCFLPLQHESLVAAKFWGGIKRIVEKIRVTEADEEAIGVCSAFRLLARKASKSAKLLSHGQGPVPGSFKIPSTLYRSFLGIMILIVELRDDHVDWDTKVTELVTKIEVGRNELCAGFSDGSLSDQEAIVPVGLLALLAYQLCDGITYHRESDLLFDAYQQTLDSLEASTQRNPRDRSNQVKLVYVKQELKAVMSIVAEQERLLQTFSDVLGPEATGWATQLFRTPRDRASMIVDRAKNNCDDKLKDLRSLLDQAEIILENHSRLIEAVKDTHESASLTFAIVSVIFLPLTAVASILGMNTSDMRNMGQKQWVFWAAGLPLAALTGLFCLWCTAQLDEFGTWARDRWYRSRLCRELRIIWKSANKPKTERMHEKSGRPTDVEVVYV